MRLVSLTVKNFRSITKAYKLHLGNSTVLIGPNNEGKSNILRALVMALRVLSEGVRPFQIGGGPEGSTIRRQYRFSRIRTLHFYNWKKDFPVGKQGENPPGASELVLEFELRPDELVDFRDQIGSQLNGNLPIRVTLGQDDVKVQVAKQGRGGKSLTAKSPAVAEFVKQRLDFQYIPAVRTAESAQQVVDRMLEVELESVENDPNYTEALNEIARLQQPVLDRVSSAIRETLTRFLPAINDVKVNIASEARIRALRRSEIIVDDGTPTPLTYKGDGVQSLAALALMRHSSETTSKGKHLILALEEPESHLHPSAIHGLKSVLDELASVQQIVLTTHCPLFVDRTNISANILVNENTARAAKHIREIREILGVRASDNLRHAELVLVVEGQEDEVALSALIAANSDPIKRALSQGTLAVETLNGATNLAYKVSLLRDALCDCLCFLDHDAEATASFSKAKAQGLLTDADVTFARCNGMKESEIEDMYDLSAYEQAIQNKYGVRLILSPKFRSAKKWSERAEAAFAQLGKLWNDRVEIELKKVVAEAIASNPGGSLNPHKRSAFDALVGTLEERLASVEPDK
jgi:putative ATP-dependent endonuclease of OLD family